MQNCQEDPKLQQPLLWISSTLSISPSDLHISWAREQATGESTDSLESVEIIYSSQSWVSMFTCFSHGNHNKGSGPTWMFPCWTPHVLRTNAFSLYHSSLCTSINYHNWFKQTPSITMGLPLSEPLDLNQVLFSAPNSLFPETYVLYKKFSAYVWKQFIMPSHKAAV